MRMPIQAGTHRFGPDNARLSVRTGRGGAAAKAGHDLAIGVTRWSGTLEVGEDLEWIAVALDADATSLRVHKGTGGIQALGEDDKVNIQQTIDDEVLRRQDITFRSGRASSPDGGRRVTVEGDLTLVGRTQPVVVEVAVGDDGTVSATAVVTQTRWGMKPYSALFGALKVLDDVEVRLESHSGSQSA